ncbi:HAD family hydrolase [Pararhizobium mangrovi]|uniref:HAD family hydrolase n=1 Tax=Pararhizobium mangrovi TaxID=2590452 RepID=A0A506U6A5_9HYPH|nr:HAD family hydrolase [Pararhizobium mangrovi]TPW29018.1 HAD family hydrolase [Pararhizobium mangrovi]
MSSDRMVIAFDLDDTLYLERDFAFSGFKAGEAFLFRRLGVGGLAAHCEHLFDCADRSRIFDVALVRLGLPADPELVAALVNVYRTHAPAISLAPDARRFFQNRHPRLRTALITDGPATTQAAKIDRLGLDGIIDRIILTDLLGPGREKPHPAAYALVEEWAGPGAGRLVYVADNPLKDFVTAKARGWWTIGIERRGRVHMVEPPDTAHAPHSFIQDLDDLNHAIGDLSRRHRYAARGTAPAPVRTQRPGTHQRLESVRKADTIENLLPPIRRNG